MLVVKGLITENITIAATIHSPTPKVQASPATKALLLACSPLTSLLNEECCHDLLYPHFFDRQAPPLCACMLQPGTICLQTFALFDRILILQRGRVVYFGPNGSSALQYFQGSPHFQVSNCCRRVLHAASCCQLEDPGELYSCGAAQDMLTLLLQVRPRGADESPAEWIVGRAVLCAAHLYVGL